MATATEWVVARLLSDCAVKIHQNFVTRRHVKGGTAHPCLSVCNSFLSCCISSGRLVQPFSIGYQLCIVACCCLQVEDKGDGFQFIAIGTKNVFKTAESIKQAGAPLLQDVCYFPGTAITSVVTQDPSGWKFVFFNEDDYIKDVKHRKHLA